MRDTGRVTRVEEETVERNPYRSAASTCDGSLSSPALGFRRGVRNGFRYSLPFSLVLGFTCFSYAFFDGRRPVSDASFERMLLAGFCVLIGFGFPSLI